jgi:hypothetical protein
MAESTNLTGTGAAVGTPDYMALERYLEGYGDHRVGVYSLARLRSVSPASELVLIEGQGGSRP